MKTKKYLFIIAIFFLSLEFASARGIALGANSVGVDDQSDTYGVHLTLENFMRLGDSKNIIGGANINYDSYNEDNKTNIIDFGYGIGFQLDKKLNIFVTAGIAYQTNSSSTVAASLGYGGGIGLTYRLTKQTYFELKRRYYAFSDDINGEIDDYNVAINSAAVAFMF